MRILLLHDDIYLPSYGGGIKVNRCLMESLAARGHSCAVMAHALTRSQDGPTTRSEFDREMARRGLPVEQPQSNVLRYRCRNVVVDGLLDEQSYESRAFVARRIDELQPDWIVVTEDKRQVLLPAAIRAGAERVVLLLQTVTNLPFGPRTIRPSESQATLMHRAKAAIVISAYLQQYLREHSALQPYLISLPVFGDGPFPDYGCPDKGWITMINPCDLKGLSVFLALSEAFPAAEFAAVPTWGADAAVRARLEERPNVRVLEPADGIDQVLSRTRILLAPSLWPETFGLVAPEAMLRGIPVMASNVCGLPGAKLGVDYVLPVRPAEWRGDRWHCPDQDVTPWARTLDRLLTDPDEYRRVSRASRQAAHAFVSRIDVGDVERLFESLAGGRPKRARGDRRAAAAARKSPV